MGINKGYLHSRHRATLATVYTVTQPQADRGERKVTYLLTYTTGLGKFDLKTTRTNSPEQARQIFHDWTQVTPGMEQAYLESIHEVGQLVYGQD